MSLIPGARPPSKPAVPAAERSSSPCCPASNEPQPWSQARRASSVRSRRRGASRSASRRRPSPRGPRPHRRRTPHRPSRPTCKSSRLTTAVVTAAERARHRAALAAAPAAVPVGAPAAGAHTEPFWQRIIWALHRHLLSDGIVASRAGRALAAAPGACGLVGRVVGWLVGRVPDGASGHWVREGRGLVC